MSSWDFIRITLPAAGKVHRCESCRETIEKGQKHAYTSGRTEGFFLSYRQCLRCYELAQAWCEHIDDEGFPLGESLDAAIREETGCEDVDAWLAAHKTIARRQSIVAKARDQAVSDVVAERQRQIEIEGWSPEHDDAHAAGEMALAAASYAYEASRTSKGSVPASWPWSGEWWKPRDARGNLVRAGALILAEIERLDREAARG